MTMLKTRSPTKIIYSTSSDESYSSIKNVNANNTANSKSQPKNIDSYDYDYSYSSEESIPKLIYSPPRIKLLPNARKNTVQKKNCNTISPSPKPMNIDQSSDYSMIDENNESDQICKKVTEKLSSELNTPNISRQEEKIVEEIKESLPTNDSSPNSEDANKNDNIKLDSENKNADTNDQRNDDDENYYNSYFCSKMKFKSPNNFTFNQKSVSLFYAKSKGIFSSHVYISSNENFNIKDKQYEYVMKISHNRTLYELRKLDDKTNLLVMSFNNDYGKEYGPRKINMEWPSQNLKYVSRIPKKTESGNWELNFNGKYVIASQKNGIILDNNSMPAIMIRKVHKSILQIEVIRNIDPIFLFALGIASFICPF